LLVWNSVLSYEEMMQVTRYLKYNVLGYVAPPPAPPPPPEAPPLSIPEGVPKDGLVAWFASKRASADWKSQVGDLTADVKEGKPSVKAEAGHGAAGEVMALYGDTSDKIDLGKILPSTYTICSLTRYATTDRRYMGRILIGGGKSTNWLHGHWAQRRGVSHYDGWMTNVDSKGIVDDWLIMCGTNGASRQFVDGDDVATGRSSTQGDLSVGINYAPPGGCCGGEVSNWAVAEILTWSRVLSEDEMRSVTSYLRYDVLGFKRPGPLPSGIPHHNLAVWFPSATADKDAWLSAVPGGRMLVGSTVGGDVNVRTDEPGQDGAVGAVRCLYGDHNAQFTFGDNVVPTTFTMCSLTRYTTTDGRYQKRILIGGPGNFLHGHWMGLRGVAYYDNWMTQYQRSEGDSKTDWLIMCGTNGAARQLVDGNEVANERATRGNGGKGLGVNYAPRYGQWSNERSHWAVAELLVWNSVLSYEEMMQVTRYLKYNVLGYVAPPPAPPPPPEAPPRAVPEGIPEEDLVAWFASSRVSTDWKSEVGDFTAQVKGGKPSVKAEAGFGAESRVQALHGDENAQISFGDNLLPSTFTLCSITRYTTNEYQYKKRILIGGPGNFLHGHWMGRRGVAYYDAWMTPYGRSVGGSVTDWLVMCGTNGAARQLVDGENVAEKSVIRGGGSGGGDKGLGVNYAPRGGQYSNERSRWAVAELLVWKRVLSIMEMREVTKYLQHHVLAAKPPPPPPPAHKFSIVDADHSGGVNRMELVALIEKAAGLNNAHAIVSDDLWNKLDKNDDGKLDAAEFAAVSQRMSAHTLFIEPVLVYPPQKQTAKAFTTIRNVPKVEHGAVQQVTTRHQIIEKACENFVLLRQGTLAIPDNSGGWNEWYDELNDDDIDPLSGVKECSALDENETAARVLGDAADAYVLPMLVTAPGSNVFFIDPAAMLANTEESTEDGEDEDLFARFEREGLTLELKPAETNNGNDVALAVV